MKTLDVEGPAFSGRGPSPRFPRHLCATVRFTAEEAASAWQESTTARNWFSFPEVAATCLNGLLPESKFQNYAFFQIMALTAMVAN